MKVFGAVGTVGVGKKVLVFLWAADIVVGNIAVTIGSEGKVFKEEMFIAVYFSKTHLTLTGVDSGKVGNAWVLENGEGDFVVNDNGAGSE